MPKIRQKGVVLGDFTPLTNAHVYLIQFAKQFVDDLTVVIDEHEADEISVDTRLGWLKETCPGVTIRLVPSKRWHKSNDTDFSPSLVAGLRKLLPKPGGYIFSLEGRGKLLAEKLGARYLPIDAQKLGFGATPREIFKNPLGNWAELPAAVRPHFVRRVCIFGPESTGKSTLARRLAARFQTVAVPEFADMYIKSQGRDLDDAAMLNIYRGQTASEDALARQANRVLFCDSDMVTSYIWSGRLVGTIPEKLKAEADRRQYALYILTDVDVPFVDDVHRYIPAERRTFLDRCLLELESRHRPFVHVKGGYDERYEQAVKAIEEMLAQ